MIPLERPIVSLDFETTGIDPMTARIWEIGVAKLYPDGLCKEWHTLVNPTIQIPDEVIVSLKMGGDLLKRIYEAETFRMLHLKFAKALEGSDLLGYNLIHFDVPLLQQEFTRCGFKWEPPHIVDLFRLWQRFYPRNLTAFIEEFVHQGIEGEEQQRLLDEYQSFQAHDAQHDSRWTLKAAHGFFRACKEAPRTVKEVSDLFLVTPRDSHSLDPDGKIRWNKSGEAYIAFGKKHNGQTLRLVATIDKGFLEWITRDNFSPAVKRIVADALNGQFPVRGV